MKKLGTAFFALLLTAALPTATWAETVMEKVARTGVLNAGTATDKIPLAYVNDQQELVGYSVDMIKLIAAQLEEKLGRKITLVIDKVTVDDRISKIVSGQVDLVCEAVSFTWERDQFVDFSLSYGISSTKILVKNGTNLGSPESLIGKKVGVIPNTFEEKVIKQIQPAAVFLPIQSIAEGFSALAESKIDAFAGEEVLLSGFRNTVNNAEDFEIQPAKPYTQAGFACMVPEGNSKFLDNVNYAIAKFMQGYLLGNSQSVAIVNRWFGPEGIITIDPKLVTEFFSNVIRQREQIPLSVKK